MPYKYLTIFLILIIPFRFILNGFSNYIIGAVFPSMQLIFGLAYLNVFFRKKISIRFEDVVVVFLIVLFYILILINSNYSTVASAYKTSMLTTASILYLFAPFVLIFFKKYIQDSAFEQILIFFTLITMITIFLRLYQYSQFFSFADPISTRMYLSLFRNPLEIMNTDTLGIDSIPSGRFLGLIMLVIILIPKWNKFIKFIVILPMLYFSILIANRQSLLAMVLLLLLFSKLKTKVVTVVMISVVFMLLNYYIGFENTRYFTDNGGERSELWMTFFNNLDMLKLFGNGINSFGTIYLHPNVYPHNFSMELIYEIGIVAYCFILIMFLFFVHSFFKKDFNSKSSVKKFLSISILYYFIVSHISGDMNYNLLFISLLEIYCILYFKLKRSEGSEQ